jgi:hypothetical protein
MAISVLMVYQPIESTREKERYWRSYVSYYEKYWDGPATPQSSWFGKEYDEFRKSLSNHLGLNKKEIQDCFFQKDEEGNYFIVPVGKEININIFSTENFIPFEWFLMFPKEEKHYFYTHMGFGAIQPDAIYYHARVEDTTQRLKQSKEGIESALNNIEAGSSQYLAETLKELHENIDNLQSWLSGFDSKSFIILNYAEICSHIEPDSMKNEDSVSEIHNILSMAAEGKFDEAESALTYLTSKWREIRAVITGDGLESTSTVQ